MQHELYDNVIARNYVKNFEDFRSLHLRAEFQGLLVLRRAELRCEVSETVPCGEDGALGLKEHHPSTLRDGLQQLP